MSVFSAVSSPSDDVVEDYDMMLLSDPQFHVVDEGGSTSLECAFRCSTYTLFDYPVIWRKQQLSEWTQVNVMGSLNKPFVSTDRVEVTFSNVSSRYLFELKISGQSVSQTYMYISSVFSPVFYASTTLVARSNAFLSYSCVRAFQE